MLLGIRAAAPLIALFILQAKIFTLSPVDFEFDEVNVVEFF